MGPAMTFKREGDRVTLEMSCEDYAMLTRMCGYAAGAVLKEGDKEQFWRQIRFVNDLNRTNPNFRPYEIPEEFTVRLTERKAPRASAAPGILATVALAAEYEQPDIKPGATTDSKEEN